MGDAFDSSSSSSASSSNKARQEMERLFSVDNNLPTVDGQWGPPTTHNTTSILKILHDNDTESTSSGTLTPDVGFFHPPTRRPSLKERAGNLVTHCWSSSFRKHSSSATTTTASSQRIPVRHTTNSRRNVREHHHKDAQRLSEDEHLTRLYDSRTWDMYLRITHYRKQQNYRSLATTTTRMIPSVPTTTTTTIASPPPPPSRVVHDDDMLLGDLEV